MSRRACQIRSMTIRLRLSFPPKNERENIGELLWRLAPLSATINAKGSRRVWLRGDGVVPVAVEVVWCEGDGGEFGVADLDAGRVPVRVVAGLDGEPGAGGCVGDEFDDGAQAGEGSSAPVHGDVAEHAVLDPVPLAGAGRVVADGDA